MESGTYISFLFSFFLSEDQNETEKNIKIKIKISKTSRPIKWFYHFKADLMGKFFDESKRKQLAELGSPVSGQDGWQWLEFNLCALFRLCRFEPICTKPEVVKHKPLENFKVEDSEGHLVYWNCPVAYRNEIIMNINSS